MCAGTFFFAVGKCVGGLCGEVGHHNLQKVRRGE